MTFLFCFGGNEDLALKNDEMDNFVELKIRRVFAFFAAILSPDKSTPMQCCNLVSSCSGGDGSGFDCTKFY